MARTKPPVEGRPVGWDATVERFCTYLDEQERSPHTVQAYGHDLHLFSAWYQSTENCEPELATIDPSELKRWKAEMSDRALKPASVNRRLASVQSLLKWAQSHEWCQAVQMPRQVRQQAPLPRWLTRPEEHALVRAVKAAGDPRDQCLVTFLLHTGARIAEAAAVKWSDIEIQPRSGKVELVGKGRKQRPVPLDSEARAALTLWSGQIEPWGVPGVNRYVFEGQRGPMNPKSLGARVAGYGPRAKLFDLTAHVLRHTCAKRWLELGMALEKVAALLGHESLETTRRYVEPSHADLQALVERRCGGEDEEPRPSRPRRRSR